MYVNLKKITQRLIQLAKDLSLNRGKKHTYQKFI